MAPFLFLLVAEGFSSLMNNAVNINLFKGFEWKRGGTLVILGQLSREKVIEGKSNPSVFAAVSTWSQIAKIDAKPLELWITETRFPSQIIDAINIRQKFLIEKFCHKFLREYTYRKFLRI